MNCRLCGAPLPAVDSTGHYRCNYCDSLASVHDSDESVDGVVITSNQSEHDCVLCHGTLHLGSIDGALIHACKDCKGILMASEVFGTVSHRRRANFQGAEVAPEPITPDDLQRRLDCPQCRRKMDCHPFSGPGAVVIDSCAHCHLVWLDVGELTKIEQAPGRRGRQQSTAGQSTGQTAVCMPTESESPSIWSQILHSLFC